jgi:hypothetical protein
VSPIEISLKVRFRAMGPLKSHRLRIQPGG